MRAKRPLCLQVLQNLILKEQLGGKSSSVAGTGEGLRDFTPTSHLFMISVSCWEASRTCLCRLSKTERGQRRPPVHGWGAGIWEPAGVAGTEGKVRDMWYLLIHLLLQVGEGHPQQVERPASVPAQGIRELQGHSTTSPLLSHLEATEEQPRPSDPSSPPALSRRDHPSAPGRPWCPGWMSR